MNTLLTFSLLAFLALPLSAQAMMRSDDPSLQNSGTSQAKTAQQRQRDEAARTKPGKEVTIIRLDGQPAQKNKRQKQKQ